MHFENILFVILSSAWVIQTDAHLSQRELFIKWQRIYMFRHLRSHHENICKVHV